MRVIRVTHLSAQVVVSLVLCDLPPVQDCRSVVLKRKTARTVNLPNQSPIEKKKKDKETPESGKEGGERQRERDGGGRGSHGGW